MRYLRKILSGETGYMHVNLEKTTIICALEDRLGHNCKIILFRLKDTGIFHELCMAVSGKQENVEIWTCADYADECDRFSFVSLISQTEMDEIMDIYRLYEFTDSLIVLSEDPVCPGMMNYIRQGVMDEQSMIAAITYNIR